MKRHNTYILSFNFTSKNIFIFQMESSAKDGFLVQSGGVHVYSFDSTKDMEMISCKVKKLFPNWGKMGQFRPQPT